MDIKEVRERIKEMVKESIFKFKIILLWDVVGEIIDIEFENFVIVMFELEFWMIFINSNMVKG